MHSTASDGHLSPAAVVERAAESGVRLMALTDHDSVDGVAEAQTSAREQGIACLAGIELSARWARGVVHIVGLDIDITSPALVEGVTRQQAERHDRAARIAERLAGAGVPGMGDRVAQLASGVPGRAHFARALVEQGASPTFQAAFERYLKRGRPGYAAVQWASIDEVVAWIHAAGGTAVFAHPLRYGLSRGALRAVIQAFVDAGGGAIEVANGGGGRDDLSAAAALARRFGLTASKGSDFHDPDFPWIEIGRLEPIPRDLTPVWETLRVTPDTPAND
ncbi:PHP domain-containing protein [Spiribacter vilamensis]|nr:PHP domain-containing protein [Spiribacter vilamensis]TVO61125.1 PHP domain-containing protein [Spiribacter vilamensis]